jgi:hypothetical protein
MSTWSTNFMPEIDETTQLHLLAEESRNPGLDESSRQFGYGDGSTNGAWWVPWASALDEVLASQPGVKPEGYPWRTTEHDANGSPVPPLPEILDAAFVPNGYEHCEFCAFPFVPGVASMISNIDARGRFCLGF